MGRRDFRMRGFRVLVALLISFFAGLRSRVARLRHSNDMPPVHPALVPVAVAAGFSLSAAGEADTSASVDVAIAAALLLAGAATYRFPVFCTRG